MLRGHRLGKVLKGRPARRHLDGDREELLSGFSSGVGDMAGSNLNTGKSTRVSGWPTSSPRIKLVVGPGEAFSPRNAGLRYARSVGQRNPLTIRFASGCTETDLANFSAGICEATRSNSQRAETVLSGLIQFQQSSDFHGVGQAVRAGFERLCLESVAFHAGVTVESVRARLTEQATPRPPSVIVRDASALPPAPQFEAPPNSFEEELPGSNPEEAQRLGFGVAERVLKGDQLTSLILPDECSEADVRAFGAGVVSYLNTNPATRSDAAQEVLRVLHPLLTEISEESLNPSFNMPNFRAWIINPMLKPRSP